MGFLDNTTNNIILDAVLTDTGRQFLSRNDGSFSIFKFALGDDEVNYGWIKKYGRTVGKEKIQKNTPIFEAITNQNQALKYKLVSVSNPNLVYMPKLSIKRGGNSTGVVNLSTTGKNTAETLTIEQQNGLGPLIDAELQDVMFMIEMSDMFLQIPNGGSNLQSIDANRNATYKYTSSGTNSEGGSTLVFRITAKILTNQMFAVYGQNNVIETYVKITGMQSGASIDIPVNITL